MCLPYCVEISTAEVGFVEKCGKYDRILQPGINIVAWPMEQMVGRLSFHEQQLDLRVESVTLDKVPITCAASVKYRALREKVYQAFCASALPEQQITARVYDVLRSKLPSQDLHTVLKQREELQTHLKNALEEPLSEIGYQILQVLVVDLDRSENVMEDIDFSGGSNKAVPTQSAPSARNENIGFDGCCCFQCIHTHEVGVLEELGQFQRILDPGCHCICWPCSLIAGRLDLRGQQLDVWCKSKTKDSAYALVNVSIYYRIIRENAYDAFYRLLDPHGQMRYDVFDVIRSTVPKLDSEEVLHSTDDIAAALLQSLRKSMKYYGYEILDTLVTKVSVESRTKAVAPLAMTLEERNEKLELMPEVTPPLSSTLNECAKSPQPIPDTTLSLANAVDRGRTPSENPDWTPSESPSTAIPGTNVVYKGTEYIG